MKPQGKGDPFWKTSFSGSMLKFGGCKLELRDFSGGESPDPRPPIWE